MEKSRILTRILDGNRSFVKGTVFATWLFKVKLSADREASVNFISAFNTFVEEQELSLTQIFNCDETGLISPAA